MSTRMLAEIERSMEEFLQNEGDSDDWTQLDFWCHDELAAQMAQAAYAVLIACAAGQRFAKSQE